MFHDLVFSIDYMKLVSEQRANFKKINKIIQLKINHPQTKP